MAPITGVFNESRWAGPEPRTATAITTDPMKSTRPITFHATAATVATGKPDDTHQAIGSAVAPTNTSRLPAQTANTGFASSRLATPARNDPPTKRTTMVLISHERGVASSNWDRWGRRVRSKRPIPARTGTPTVMATGYLR